MSTMSENTQNSYNFDYIFSLVEKIIIQKDFKSLTDLDKQCDFILHDISEQTFDEEKYNTHLDCLFIFLYYIYYVMLEEKDELIFRNLRNLIMYNNNELVKYYYNDECLIEDLKKQYLDKGETELYNLFILAMHILHNYNSYSGSSKLEDLSNSNISKIINIIYRNNYTAIPNELYLICMLGSRIFNYREKLELSAYDNLYSRLNDIIVIILEKYHNNQLFSDILTGDDSDKILEEAGALNW